MKSGALLAVALMFLATAAGAQQVIYGDPEKTKKIQVSDAKPVVKPGKVYGYIGENSNKTCDDVRSAIGRNWYPPRRGKGPVIRMKLDMHGSVSEKYIVESSGDSLMDESAMNAIEYQAPEFQALRNMYKEGAFDVIFNYGWRKPILVRLRLAPAEDAPPKPGDQSSADEGNGNARITGKVVGARDNHDEKNPPND